jgi:hypothetical protein
MSPVLIRPQAWLLKIDYAVGVTVVTNTTFDAWGIDSGKNSLHVVGLDSPQECAGNDDR